MLNALMDHAVWRAFREYKVTGGHISKEDINDLDIFIESKGYEPIVRKIVSGESFSPPEKKEISKMNSGKKRTIYTYGKHENWVLKLLTHLLQEEYDYFFPENLYSFRRHKGVRVAIKRLTESANIGNMWSYKVDISNYFNSIPVQRLLPMLEELLIENRKTYCFLESLLLNPHVLDHGILVSEEKGIMAGVPVSAFLANLYLSHMDRYFAEAGFIYARYSDDIIVFGETKVVLEERVAQIRGFISAAGLEINPEKEEFKEPGQMWTFLGVSYCNGVIDVAPASVEKLKGKMRRKARALMRWKARKGASGEQAAKAFIRAFNRKLFENPAEHELTWARWYFPLINTTESLREIDAYSQSCIRYLATGTHSKRSFNFRYEDMKALGYVSLVNRYYKPGSSLST